MPCVISLLIYIKLLYFLFWSVSLYLCFSLYIYMSLSSKQLYLGFYIIRIASLQGNHGYFSYKVKNKKKKQDKMKLENIYGKIQSSFTLLLSTIHSIILFTLHNNNVTSSHEKLFAGEHNPTPFRLLYMDALGMQQYAINSLLFLRVMQDKYISLYRELFTQLHSYVSAIRALAK